MPKILVESLLESMIKTFWSNRGSNLDAFKTLSKKLIKKTGEATNNFTINEKIEKITKALSCKSKFDVEIEKIQNLVKKQWKHQKKDTYHEKRDSKLLINLNWYKNNMNI